MIRLVFGWACLITVALAGAPTRAATILVSPGPGTPIQDAIDAAAPGDTVRLTSGTFNEHLVIGKRLKLQGVDGISSDASRLTLINGGCTPGPMITIAADDVQVRDLALNLWIDGGIVVSGRTRIKLKGVFAINNCSAASTASPFEIVNSTRVTLDHIWGTGPYFPIPAGIRIADTPQDGRVKLRKSIAGGAGAAGGILLENNGINAVRVSSNDSYGSDRGIYVVGTSRAIIDHNRVGANATSGIEIAAGSSGNQIISNFMEENGVDVVDNGAGNCWRHNAFTSGSTPSCP
jgi:nitrous oxidase accessory protein NosD